MCQIEILLHYSFFFFMSVKRRKVAVCSLRETESLELTRKFVYCYLFLFGPLKNIMQVIKWED